MPSSGSLARSGCGIMPSTLRPSLQMPAMFSSEPLGLASAVTSPFGVHVAEHDAVLVFQFRQRLLVAEVIAFHVADGNLQHFALGQLLRVRSVRALDANVHGLADVLQVRRCASARPGSSPDSQRIWKPLQMPRTSPPSAANLRTDSMTGENFAIAPVRR